ncbi:hypothetical protein ADUPG1_012411 [Aduncisulcus paluster]|uniref:Uncharacterized protein n=1 Tax=Aduncisulcus paluster TaxID=2918883 RepID=A0ABQ5JZC3_9EUKA|nr:hypothetical protein ADUPG1_012411 [Aduncisulcus paluster]
MRNIFRFVLLFITSIIFVQAELAKYLGSVKLADTLTPIDLESGYCFKTAQAWIDPESPTKVLTIENSEPASDWCVEIYMLITTAKYKTMMTFWHGKHGFPLYPWRGGQDSEGNWVEEEFLKDEGAMVYAINTDLVNDALEIFNLIDMFITDGIDPQKDYLEEYADMTIQTRMYSPSTKLSASDFHPGDVIVQHRWTPYETLTMAWDGMQAGHCMIIVEDPATGIKYVSQSVWDVASEYCTDRGVCLIPLDEFLDTLFDNCLEEECAMALLPLTTYYRGLFDGEAAYEWAKSREGMAYGFHKVVFSLIDSEYIPAPFSQELILTLLAVADEVGGIDKWISGLVQEGLNIRLGTSGLDLPRLLVECDEQGVDVFDLLAEVEYDSYDDLYSEGETHTSAGFVFGVLEAAGVMGDLTFERGEQTVRDLYELALFARNSIPSACQNKQESGQYFCQFAGSYLIDLSTASSLIPYDHMNETCELQPPDFKKQAGC